MTLPRECFGCDFALVHHVTIIFAVANGTTISFRLGSQYGPVLSLSFLDVCGSATIHRYESTFYGEIGKQNMMSFRRLAR